MSGFVGLWHRDGLPVDPALLAELTESLRFRGPDGLSTWHRGAIGLGFARFTTDPARDSEPQPLGLDGRYSIVGDVRLDARQELMAALGAPAGTQDAALVLRAYRAWGEACVEHIHGDFAFAIWDQTEQRLFCVRDPFGVRPFFYAQFDDLFLFSNTLNCLREHPRVSNRLYEPALADYLAAGHLLEFDKTFFADIARLSPGHALSVESRQTRIKRYWTLPLEPELRALKEQEVVDHFVHLMSQALSDRCLPGPTGLFLSGGLDSGMLAAIGAGRLGQAPPTPLAAVCVSSGPFDPEPRFAQVSSRALGIPLDVLEEPQSEPFAGWNRPEGTGPEPDYNPYRGTLIRALSCLGQRTRVALNGQGGDEVLWREYALDEALRGPIVPTARGAIRAWRASGRRPALGLRLAWERLIGRRPAPWPTTPRWLDAGWARRAQVTERFRAFESRDREQPALPRAAARQRLTQPMWATYLESHDPGITGKGLRTTWPFLDERIVRFALRLPPFPWCAEKHLARRALQGVLPDEIVRRTKAVVTADPLVAYVEARPDWHTAVEPASRMLRDYVDLGSWRTECGAIRGRAREAILDTWALARVLGLNYWLGHVETGRRPRFGADLGLDRSSRSPHDTQFVQPSRVHPNTAEAV